MGSSTIFCTVWSCTIHPKLLQTNISNLSPTLKPQPLLLHNHYPPKQKNISPTKKLPKYLGPSLVPSSLSVLSLKLQLLGPVLLLTLAVLRRLPLQLSTFHDPPEDETTRRCRGGDIKMNFPPEQSKRSGSSLYWKNPLTIYSIYIQKKRDCSGVQSALQRFDNPNQLCCFFPAAVSSFQSEACWKEFLSSLSLKADKKKFQLFLPCCPTKNLETQVS